MKLRRYWSVSALTTADPHPAGTLLGCGVTAYSREDAEALMKERVFTKVPFPAIAGVREDVDVSTLDAGHVLPNMGNVLKRGIWFPIGYDWPRF